MPTITRDGLNLSYLDSEGTGAAVVLLHAFPLRCAMWGPQIAELGEDFRVLAPDLMGFGSSDAPDDPSAYSMDRYADDVALVLDHAGVQSAVACGLSMGGYVSLAFLRRHPERLAGLVLADTKGEADDEETRARRTAQQDKIRSAGARAVTDPMTTSLLGRTTLETNPGIVQRVRHLMDNPGPGLIGALEAMKNRSDSTPDLGAVRVPSLVIVGEEDEIAPPDAARRLHEHIRGSRLDILPEAGHLSNLETAADFNQALGSFLKEL